MKYVVEFGTFQKNNKNTNPSNLERDLEESVL